MNRNEKKKNRKEKEKNLAFRDGGSLEGRGGLVSLAAVVCLVTRCVTRQRTAAKETTVGRAAPPNVLQGELFSDWRYVKGYRDFTS